MSLTTPFGNPSCPTPDLSGQGVISRGSDPNIDLGGGGSGLTAVPWSSPITPTPGGEETANSISGLPPIPARWEPSETPVDPPSLERRNPGTIDKR